MKKVAKQVIILRKDLNMRDGKMVAQGAHASLACILNLSKKSEIIEYTQTENYGFIPTQKKFIEFQFEKGSPIDIWLNDIFTKVTLSVDNEEELLAIYKKAKRKGLNTVLITDAGLTEFNGIPTNTVVGIGPHWAEDIDQITGHLKLL